MNSLSIMYDAACMKDYNAKKKKPIILVFVSGSFCMFRSTVKVWSLSSMLIIKERAEKLQISSNILLHVRPCPLSF